MADSRHGVALDTRAVATQDTDETNDGLTIASILAISQSDRFNGYSNDFDACPKNGTFSR